MWRNSIRLKLAAVDFFYMNWLLHQLCMFRVPIHILNTFSLDSEWSGMLVFCRKAKKNLEWSIQFRSSGFIFSRRRWGLIPWTHTVVRWKMVYGRRRWTTNLGLTHLVQPIHWLLAFPIWYFWESAYTGYGWRRRISKCKGSNWGRISTITFWDYWLFTVLLSLWSDW